MDPITALIAGRTIQGVTESILRSGESEANSSTETEQSAENAGQIGEPGGFELFLRGILKPNGQNQVSEEDLYAALLQERIQSLKGDEAASEFSAALSQKKGEMARGDGYVPVEDAANHALDQMVSSGVLTAGEAAEIRAQSFRAAQLDNNTSALFDGRGGPGDSTVAVSDMESALLAARAMIQQLEDGTVSLTDSELSAAAGESKTVAPSGNTIDGPDGFVFKPESESDGKVVILLPPNLTGDVTDVLLKGQDETIIERGRSTGIANGGREHFRFEQPGAGYPQDLTVEIRLSNGEIIRYEIPNPRERYD